MLVAPAGSQFGSFASMVFSSESVYMAVSAMTVNYIQVRC
jgi:hypothetical protein